MRKIWIGAAAIAALALASVGPLSAQQTQSVPRSTSAPTLQSDPSLDTDDQLAPSQIKQPMPAAVAEPGGAATHGATHPVRHAAADASPAAAPEAKPAGTRGLAPFTTTIDCAKGPFSRDSSHLRLAMTFDSKNVGLTEVDANGGSKVQASVVFPNDPKRRIEVWWSNQPERRDTYLIDIHGKSMWTAPGGMKLGLTLLQLEKLNHKPFKLKGFDKDGVATVSDWDGGALGSLAGGCKSGVSLRADPKAPADAVGTITADKEYSSSDAEFRAVKPTVSEILIGF